MRIPIAALILAAALLARPAAAADTQQFGNRVLVTGDSVAVLLEVAGQPDRVVQLENRLGAAAGERWEYYRGGKVTLVVIRGARVVSIQRE